MPRPFKPIRSQSDLFTEMSKYQTGVADDGSPTFSIPLPPDADGMVGRECRSSDCTLRYFKIRDDGRDDAGETTTRTCPYCGHQDACEEFYTGPQLDWIERRMHSDIEQTISRSLHRQFKRLARSQRGPLKITATVSPCRPRAVAPYVEEKLKRATTCDHCNSDYAVYGVSYFCPFCSGGTLPAHIRQNCETVRKLVSIATGPDDSLDQPVRDQLVGNAYEDTVTVFEGFLRRLYELGLKTRCPPEEVARLVGKVGNTFQNLRGAEANIRKGLGIDLFAPMEASDRERLAVVFCKRHLLTHNLGLVDDRYKAQVSSWQSAGQEIPLSAEEVSCAIDSVERLLCGLHSQL